MKLKGRPKLADGLKKSEVIPVRFTVDEADRIYSQALKDGGSASSTIRTHLKDFLYKQNEPLPPTT